ncbi:MAG: LamG domain-containing protein, partial [Solirubrobacterales bacterium]
NRAKLDFGTGDWTVSAWYKTAMVGTGDANKGTIYSKGGDSTGGKRYALIMSETTEGVVSLVADDDVTKYVVDSKSVTNDDEWHCVVGQRQGASLKIYIDGQLEATGTATAAYDLSGTSQHNAYVGTITNHSTGALYKLFSGLIDDVRVYNESLSEGEILWLAGRTSPMARPF